MPSQPAVVTLQPSIAKTSPSQSEPTIVTSGSIQTFRQPSTVSSSDGVSTSNSSSHVNTSTPLSQQAETSRSSTGIKAGIAVSVLAVVIAIIVGVLLFLRRRRAKSLHPINGINNDDLPEVHVPGGKKLGIFGALARRIHGGEQVPGFPVERKLPIEFMGHESDAKEVVTSMSAKISAEPKDNQILDLSRTEPAELAGSMTQANVNHSSSYLAELQSDISTLKPGRPGNHLDEQAHSKAKSESSVPFQALSASHFPDQTPQLQGRTQVEELARLKQEAARLEEKRRRLQELGKIEEQEEDLRKQIAGLEGRT